MLKTKKGTELPIVKVQGKDYLQVQYRLVWFREECPDWSIETDFVETGPDYAVAKATIKDPTGRVLNTAHKFENVKGFGDYREKAETGAVGRALAMLGYGTQFTDELEETQGHNPRIVDAPKTPREIIKPVSHQGLSPSIPADDEKSATVSAPPKQGPSRFLITVRGPYFEKYIDDLSFEEQENYYKRIRSVLGGKKPDTKIEQLLEHLVFEIKRTKPDWNYVQLINRGD